ncbi:MULTISPECIES: GntR family transcriptional regulator [unclassified Achromobacter]|uniref:GntR family transcriptional regulator n=1 Tax=unclassified Achromobacter TaxID=2626865 RepID=UPI000B518060|nr:MULTISPECIES: GntR family transcriptional regulator [unclassified Achromobacter]OWT75695.1 GntR family transcriptional regulator [Achromobacter sp. HZ28]OWT76356.1 GntR family transcriptional regulator [Achromobacter sp. HZ34]
MEMKAPATIPYFLQEQVRRMIVDGTLRPGQPLREQELERRFGTSRSPIREALRLLELSGLVTHAQRRGFRVALYSEQEIRHIYQLRAELEAYAIIRLAEHSDLAPLMVDLHGLYARLQDCRPGEGELDCLDLTREFFNTIVLLNDNRPLTAALSKLTDRCEPLRHIVLRREVTPIAQVVEGVGRIVSALRDHDLVRAAAVRREMTEAFLTVVVRAYAAEVYPEIVASA